jgi:hypothetical protein
MDEGDAHGLAGRDAEVRGARLIGGRHGVGAGPGAEGLVERRAGLFGGDIAGDEDEGGGGVEE